MTNEGRGLYLTPDSKWRERGSQPQRLNGALGPESQHATPADGPFAATPS